MQFRVLGPLEVSAAGQPLPLGGRKQRAVLALLLLNANGLVPRERLIDALWGESPPAEADASLRVYVARLRKLLSSENGSQPKLETARSGYVLRIDPEALDLTRFRRLVASGEELLAGGRSEEASRELADALDLWRGPALAELADKEWGRRETGQLEELRLGALEARIDADLAVGRHSEVVAELEVLVAQHPYRERLVAQLMLSLYRSGRQPDALQAYATARTTLREEFGLEPTRSLRELERQILVQDVSLDLPTDEAATVRPKRRRLRPRVFVASTAAVGAIALGAAVLPGLGERAASSSQVLPLKGNSVVAIDPRTNRVAYEVALGGRPSGVAVGEGSVWVGNRDDETLLRVDPDTRRVAETIGLGAEPTGVVVGGGSVWVASESANVVLQVDPAINHVVATIDLGEAGDLCCSVQMAFARGALWVSYWGSLARIDAESRRAVLTRHRPVRWIASTGTELWGVVGVESDQIRRLDPLGDPIRFNRLGGAQGLGAGVAADRHSVWTGSYDGTLWRIDPDTGRVTASLSVGRPVASIALMGRAIWSVTRDASVLRADSVTGQRVKTIPLGVFPPSVWGGIAAGEGRVWVIALER